MDNSNFRRVDLDKMGFTASISATAITADIKAASLQKDKDSPVIRNND